MRSAKSALILLGVGAFAANIIVGCSGDESRPGYDDLLDSGSGTSLPETGSPSQDPSVDDSGQQPKPDAGSPVDASKSDADADADASENKGIPDGGEDATVVPPGTDAGATGSACATKDEIQQQPCGICGTQYRLCKASDGADASSLTWQEWGYCQREVANGCVPGTSGTEACGLCGTRQRVCQIDCGWAVGSCKNQPANACTPDAVDFQVGLSCDVGGRERTCQNNCTYGSFGDCQAKKSVLSLTLGTTARQKVTKPLTLSSSSVQPKLTGTCPSGTVSTTNTAYQYIKLVNPNASTVVVSVWTSGSGILDSVMAAYVGATSEPTNDPERKACSKGVVNCCSGDKAAGETDSTMCLGSSLCWGGLVGSKAITIGPNGTAVIYYAAFGSGTGDYVLSARIDSMTP